MSSCHGLVYVAVRGGKALTEDRDQIVSHNIRVLIGEARARPSWDKAVSLYAVDALQGPKRGSAC